MEIFKPNKSTGYNHYLEEAESLCKNIAIIDHGCTIEHTSMKKLLSQINTETFILYLQSPLKDINCLNHTELEKYSIHSIDENTLEVSVNENSQINSLFQYLSDLNIHVSSMRNKTNRLEQLFMCLVDKNRNNAELIKTLQQTTQADSLT